MTLPSFIPPTSPGESDDFETELVDQQLMELIGQGDVIAFQQLVEKHQRSVFGTVFKMLGNQHDAEDLSQQVFLRIWRSAARYQPEAKFTTWMFTIARNLVFNEIRRQRRKPTISVNDDGAAYVQSLAISPTPSPDQDAEQSELERLVDAAILDLPEKQRLAVVLRRYEEMPYEDIARTLSMTVPAVKSLLFRARSQLKTALQSYLES